MKRGLLVLACMGLQASTSWGDYLIIKINLGATEEGGAGDTAGQPPPPGGSGGPGMPGGAGGPGRGGPGGYGGPGRGGPGMPGGAGGPGRGGPGMPGGGGSGDDEAGRRGGQGRGGPGMPGGGMGGGMGGGLGGRGGPGMPGGGMGGGMGGGLGGRGGPGMPGGGPGMPGGGGKGGPGQGPNTPEENPEQKPIWFIVTVDSDLTPPHKVYSKPDKDTKEKELISEIIRVRHRWGGTDVDLVQLPKNKVFISREKYNLAEQLEYQKPKLMKEDPFKFGEWMLQHWSLPVTDDVRFGFDMQKKFEEYIDELGKQKLDAKGQARLQALVSTREQLKKPLQSDEELSRVKAIAGDDCRTLAKDHYVILHPPRLERIAEQKHKRLEHAYAAFYYWFALQGKALDPPAKQLIVILAEDSGKFDRLHKIFDSIPLTDDGFYSALDNVLVLCAERVDGRFQQFQTIASELDKELGNSSPGLSLKKLREGTPLLKKDKEEMDAKTLAWGRVVALAQAAAEDEGEISTVTHEVTQQLAAATGLLPRRVQVPTSVRLGLGSFFETVRSNGDWEAAALWSGVGSANHWLYLPIFRKLKDAEKSGTVSMDKERKAKVAKPSIVRIIADQNFANAERADKNEAEVLRDTARAEAWALTFYLAREKLPELVKFYQELSRLPRDMDLTPDIIEHAFGIAFDLQDAKNPNKLDTDKVARLEKEWRGYMDYQQLEINPASAMAQKKDTKK